MRWLPWIIGTAVVLFLWNQISGKSTPTPTSAPAAAVDAPVAAPTTSAAAAIALPAKVYFDVGAATLGADSGKTLNAVAETIKTGSLKVTVTGYTDKTGDLAVNETLAKSRSSAVARCTQGGRRERGEHRDEAADDGGNRRRRWRCRSATRRDQQAVEPITTAAPRGVAANHPDLPR